MSGKRKVIKLFKPVNIPLNCYFHACGNPILEAEIKKTKEACYRYNQLSPNDREGQNQILKNLIGNLGEDVVVMPSFWCDYGSHITFGDRFYSNHNLVITDGASVTFGSDVFVGPNCCFTTAEHALDPEQRKRGIEVAKPITVGNNVWIGAGSTILAGVSIGDNTVIGAGSLVKQSIPDHVVAVGVPCKVLRAITKEDQNRYPMYEDAF